eukprot:TRINITY_DN1896_c0_g4_i1.p1 TRINITY_DN1896_c0_g4~~TRINITY_DN1896_c0_g4_i1.p1  ORF type:complete len:384 (-),score=60.59 TRINITY_DN1896_c0_g4_i1:35-1186(-)
MSSEGLVDLIWRNSNPTNNFAKVYAQQIMKSERARTESKLVNDFDAIMKGGCVYIPTFFNDPNYKLLRSLSDDLSKSSNGLIHWSKHLKHENPDFSPTFKDIISKLAEYFDTDVYATRMNFYRDGSDWKPFHHDSHAYGGKGQREDFTIGVSFGVARELAFLHSGSDFTFSFPQKNGDVFAFNSEVNQKFMHGVPKARGCNIGPRCSIIAWGRRRTLNERNGGQPGQVIQNILLDISPPPPPPPPSSSSIISHNLPNFNKADDSEVEKGDDVVDDDGDHKEVVMTAQELAMLIDKMISSNDKIEKGGSMLSNSGGISRGRGRGRLQSGPGSGRIQGGGSALGNKASRGGSGRLQSGVGRAVSEVEGEGRGGRGRGRGRGSGGR